MHSWQGGGVILRMMTMATTMAREGVDYDKDDDKDLNDNDSVDNNNLIF